MRLNKFIASCGICSRRKADDLIQLGKIKVNGVLINTPGVNIDEESDIVEYDGKKINLERIKIVYLFSKPYGPVHAAHSVRYSGIEKQATLARRPDKVCALYRFCSLKNLVIDVKHRDRP